MIGIYEIRCDETQKSYIGQSTDIEKRWKQHVSNLDSNKHVNTNLQGDWNNYGKDRFSFTVLKECNPEYLNLFEAYYIELFDSIRNGYNDATVSRLSKKEYRDFERISHIDSIDIAFNLRTLVFAKTLESLTCVMYPDSVNDNNGLNEMSLLGMKEEIDKVFKEYDDDALKSVSENIKTLLDVPVNVFNSIESLIKDEVMKMSGVEVEIVDPGWEFGRELDIWNSCSFEIDIKVESLIKTITVNIVDTK